MTTLAVDQINSLWVVLFAGITACSPILVALITKKWGKSVGRSEEPKPMEDAWREHHEHEQTRTLIREHSAEIRSHLDRIHDLLLIDRVSR